jgi:hypothetical protein
VLFTIAWSWHGANAVAFLVAFLPTWSSSWQWELVPFGVAILGLGWIGYRLSLIGSSLNAEAKVGWGATIAEPVVYVLTGAFGGVILRIVLLPFDAYLPLTDNLWLAIYTVVAAPLFLVALTGAAVVFLGLGSRFTDDDDREWWSRFGAWLLMMSLLWCGASAVTLLLPQLLVELYTLTATAATTLGSGLITVLGGRSGKTLWKVKPSGAPKTRDEREAKSWLSIAVKIALPIFVVFFAVTLSLATDAITNAFSAAGRPAFFAGLLDGLHMRLASDPVNAWVVATALVVSALAACLVGINTFSLHAMYRSRLVRAYLGASRGDKREPDRFIGMDPQDDLPLGDARPRPGERRPLFHIVNMALNLVSGAELAWQERKAESMTATSLHAGSASLGYRDAADYGGPITLGTAMAISGAAASPNMGYHSSPVLAFLLTLFNARLGWWLGNPGPAGDGRRQRYRLASPGWALQPLFAEAFGQTDAGHPYVYVSDGGHFENLGLYEVVRRRCRFIVVIDAGADPTCGFEDLSNAIRKVRSDFGISIDLHYPRAVYSRATELDDPAKGRFAIVGEINYGDVDRDARGEPVAPGRLVYIKPAFYNYAEPIDVNNYARLNATFPHETTADQFFSESQFESYRALGRYEAEWLCLNLSENPTLDQFWQSVNDHLK